MSTVFYSWQSDLPNNTNRGFIEAAMKTAVKHLAQDPEVYEPPREIDRDTSGVAGSPDIAKTILEKIEAADAFVFDVSIALRTEKRASPNPNVLVELGYAMKTHPFQRIIMVFNTAFGKPEELPFDLRFKRALSYRAPEGEVDRTELRAALAKDLVRALKLVYAYNDSNRFSAEEGQFFADIYANARGFLDSAAEYPDRSMIPWIDYLREGWAKRAQSLRRLATRDAATKASGVAVKLNTLADDLDSLATWRPAVGGGAGFKARLAEVVAAATPLLDVCTPYIKDELAVKGYSVQKRELARRALTALDRLKLGLKQRNSDAIGSARSALAEVGGELVQLSAELEPTGDPDAGVLRPAAHALHVANIENSQEIGYGEPTELLTRLTPLLEPLARFTKPA